MKKKMTIDEAISWWNTAYEENGDYETRRYPPCIDELNDVVAIADEDDNGSNLTMYTAKNFLAWIKEAKEIYDEWCPNGKEDETILSQKIYALMEAENKPSIHETH